MGVGSVYTSEDEAGAVDLAAGAAVTDVASAAAGVAAGAAVSGVASAGGEAEVTGVGFVAVGGGAAVTGVGFVAVGGGAVVGEGLAWDGDTVAAGASGGEPRGAVEAEADAALALEEDGGRGGRGAPTLPFLERGVCVPPAGSCGVRRTAVAAMSCLKGVSGRASTGRMRVKEVDLRQGWPGYPQSNQSIHRYLHDTTDLAMEDGVLDSCSSSGMLDCRKRSSIGNLAGLFPLLRWLCGVGASPWNRSTTEPTSNKPAVSAM